MGLRMACYFWQVCPWSLSENLTLEKERSQLFHDLAFRFQTGMCMLPVRGSAQCLLPFLAAPLACLHSLLPYPVLEALSLAVFWAYKGARGGVHLNSLRCNLTHLGGSSPAIRPLIYRSSALLGCSITPFEVLWNGRLQTRMLVNIPKGQLAQIRGNYFFPAYLEVLLLIICRHSGYIPFSQLELQQNIIEQTCRCPAQKIHVKLQPSTF